MKWMTSEEARQAFLDFFAQRGHTVVASSSLIPHDDPTLLFTNAGMNQFKDVFLGLEKRSYTRATTVQKCMRVSGKHNDLENVGPSPRHHTFFEMLGNFSFGDYFKREAIRFAWDLVTEVYGIPPDRLVFTVFEDDDEAYDAWVHDIGVSPERVYRMGESTNFWMMGDTGPCGPTSELHYDWGPEACTCGEPDCSVALDNGCGRWLEIWNLVFMQFDQKADGQRVPLPQTGVDTGMGLERIVSVLQQVSSNFETDLFTPIIRRTQQLAGHTDAQVQEQIVAYRVIADHSRAAAFLIGDGALPGNVGRGYVLRMIIRRAARYGRHLGFDEPFLAGVAEAVIEKMGPIYRELVDRREHILKTITQEETRFLRTLDQGLNRLEEALERLRREGRTVVPGEVSFDLWSTYGLPLEITRDVAAEAGFAVDEAGYHAADAAHRAASTAEDLFVADHETLARYADLLDHLKSEGKLGAEGVLHDPYSGTEMVARVVALRREGQTVEQAAPGDAVEVVLDRTCFYVEAGGQVSDTGQIVGLSEGGEETWVLAVEDTRQPVSGLIVHVGRVVEGRPRVGDAAEARVDRERRMGIARNHTATHLLHRELRRVLGEHVFQAGSLVAPDRLRFDFTHPDPLTPEQIEAINAGVYAAILADYPVQPEHKPYQEAVAEGAMALFGEKYGDVVRVIRIGGNGRPFSMELCGGTHLRRTGEIGFFRIVSESSVGAGLRRIEAVTGWGAYRFVEERLTVLEEAATALDCSPDEVGQRAQELHAALQESRRTLARLRRTLLRQDFERMMGRVRRVGEVTVLATPVEAAWDMDSLRQVTDWFRDRVRSGVVVVGAVLNGRPGLVAAVTQDLTGRGLHAGRLIQRVAGLMGGKGGGRPTMANAGGGDPARMEQALEQVPTLVEEFLEGK